MRHCRRRASAPGTARLVLKLKTTQNNNSKKRTGKQQYKQQHKTTVKQQHQAHIKAIEFKSIDISLVLGRTWESMHTFFKGHIDNAKSITLRQTNPPSMQIL